MSIRNLKAAVGALALLVAITISVDRAIAQIDYTWQNEGTGNWAATGAGYNWDDPLMVGGDPLPLGEFGEQAIINNGGTAEITTTVTPGAVQVSEQSSIRITGTGSLALDDSDPNSSGEFRIGLGETPGSLLIESGGSLSSTTFDLFSFGTQIELQGTATVMTTGQSRLHRGTRIVGPDASFTTGSLSFNDNTILNPVINSAGQWSSDSPISVSADATLNGTLNAEFSGVPTPSLGDTWNLVDAAEISGNFETINASGVALGTGQIFAVRSVAGGNGSIAQLVLENRLVLEVNHDTGAAAIKNFDPTTPIAIDGYTIGSDAGYLDPLSPGGWNSLQGQSSLNWVEANDSANRLSELQFDGSTSVSNAAPLDLGTPFSPNPAGFGDPTEELTFLYSLPGGQLVTGLIEYVGSNVNNMVLIVDPTTGDAQIRNGSGFAVSIEGYQISSEAGTLDVAGWNGFRDESTLVGWVNANSDSSLLTELDFDAATSFQGGAAFNIGDIFAGAVDTEGLSFEFFIEGDTQTTPGLIVFESLPPISVPGDFDGDGDVDGDDLTDPVDGWEARFGNDLNGRDFLTWQRNFGFGTGSVAAISAIPEPMGTSLLLFGLIGLVINRK